MTSGTIHGVVVEEGGPLPGVTLSLALAGQPIATTVTDANGLYSFDGLAPGTYAVAAELPEREIVEVAVLPDLRDQFGVSVAAV